MHAIDTGTLTDLRYRALIGVMVYSFARVNAIIAMKVKDYLLLGGRGGVRAIFLAEAARRFDVTSRGRAAGLPPLGQIGPPLA